MLQHRSIIESIFNKLKNVLRIASHKSRSVTGFFAHCLSTFFHTLLIQRSHQSLCLKRDSRVLIQDIRLAHSSLKCNTI